MTCLTHVNVLYRCPRCGMVVTMHPVESRYRQTYMVHNLAMALRDKRKMKDRENYTAKATEFARWLEVKTNGY